MSSSASAKIELPRAFELADIDHLVILIADMISRLIAHNDQIPLSPEALTRFHSRSPPAISVLDYLRRIVKYANVERTCLLITLHYIDQICSRIPLFTLSSLTCHRFVISAVVVASKALCDAFCTNAFYARVGGIRVGELNLLERELLAAIDWRLTSTKEVLDAYYVNLIRTHSASAYTLAPESPSSPSLPELDATSERLDAPPLPRARSMSVSPDPDSDMDSVRSDSASPKPREEGVNDVAMQLQMQTGNHRVPVPPAVQVLPSQMILRAAPPTSFVADSARPLFEPSTVLIDRATLSPKPSTGPTLEQNMAFAALASASASTTSTSISTSSTPPDEHDPAHRYHPDMRDAMPCTTTPSPVTAATKTASPTLNTTTITTTVTTTTMTSPKMRTPQKGLVASPRLEKGKRPVVEILVDTDTELDAHDGTDIGVRPRTRPRIDKGNRRPS